MHVMIEGEVMGWNPNRGIPRVYRELLGRLPEIAPDMAITVALQGVPRVTYTGGSDIKWRLIPSVSPRLRPWFLWQHIRPVVNRLRASKFWREQQADLYLPSHYGLPPLVDPTICLAFDMIPELYPDLFKTPDARKIREIKRAALERATVVLCISENTKRDVVRLLNIDPEKCRVMSLGVPSYDESLADSSSLPVYTRKFLLYVGGHRVPYKNIDLLVSCLTSSEFPEFKDLELVVVSPERPRGGGSADAGGEEESRIRYLSRCSDGQLQQLYAECAALVMPSHYEGFGLPVLEALSHGAPVACSRAASLPEVGGEVAHYFDPRSVTELATALRHALGEGRAPEFVAKRHAQAKRFSWDEAARTFAQAARDAIGRV